jgi:predicted phosphodiesterase
MKIAMLNDTHFGVRNDSEAFREYQLRFYNEIFFPYLQEHKIKTLVHLGDVVDRRKFINFNTASVFRKQFWDRLYEEQIDTHIIIGNHDTYYKNTNEVNAIENLYTSFDKKHEPWIYTRPSVVDFDGTSILFMPWICDDTREESMKMINSAKAEIVMGHLEIKGVEMQNGVINDHGLNKSDFKRFDKVISGHFHKHTDDGQIYYNGAQYEMTWSDYKDQKAFNIFDTETREITRVINPLTIHNKIIYDDKKNNYDKFDLNPYHKHFVKLIILNKTDEEQFDRLVNRLYKEIQIHDLTILEDFSDIKASVKDEALDMGEDTITFLNNYVDQLETDVDKQKLKEYLKSFYVEANDR